MDNKTLERMKEEFIANISHELRTPLAIAKGSIELVLEEDISEEQRKILLRGKENLDRLNKTIGDLIEAAQLADNPQLHVEKVDLRELISTCFDEMSKKAALKEVKIRAAIPDNFPTIAGEKERLQRAFACILENAIKFNRRGGEVIVKGRKFNGSVEIAFKDQGIGIPRGQRHRIFDAFYQVDGSSRRRYDGMGLGLALARKIVSLHGGEILVESKKNQGSVFSVVLPVRKHVLSR